MYSSVGDQDSSFRPLAEKDGDGVVIALEIWFKASDVVLLASKPQPPLWFLPGLDG